jgi:iron(III) transport system substrate-binding protein
MEQDPDMTFCKTSTAAAALTALALPALADGELNLYSSRHYDTDERLYSDFTEATGITINRIEGKADELLARMEAEGANSPADVLLTVDTSRLKRAKDMDLLQAVESETLEERIPGNLQDDDNQWFGLSQRGSSSTTKRRWTIRQRPTWTSPIRPTKVRSASGPRPTPTTRPCWPPS